MAACMNECHSISFEFLHDESFSSEQTRSELALKFNSNRNSFRCTEKRIFLANHFTSHPQQIKRDDLTWIWRCETYFLFSLSCISKCRHKQTFPGKNTFAGRHQLA